MNPVSLITEIAAKIIPFFVVIAIGYMLRLVKIINNENVRVLNKIAYNIVLPAIIFISIIQFNINEIININIIKNIYTIYIIIIVYILLLNLLIKIPDKTRGAFMVASFRANIAFIGFPIVLAVFGSLAMAKASLMNALLMPINTIPTIFILKKYSPDKENVKIYKTILKFFIDPLIIATMAGILFSYFNISVCSPVKSIFEILSGMGIGLSLISIGASFEILNVKKRLGLMGFSVMNKLIIMPLIAFIISVYLFRVDALERDVICLLCATPLAVSSYIMGVEYKSDSDFMSSSLIVSTVISVITIPGWLFILQLL